MELCGEMINLKSISLKQVRATNVILSVAVAMALSAIIIDVKNLYGQPDISADQTPGLHGRSRVAAQGKPFNANYVILKAGFAGGAGKLSYIKDKPKSPLPGQVKRPKVVLNPNLTLVGTIVSSEGKSVAIFEDKRSRKQKAISVGEDVFGSGKLMKVEEAKALVSSGGLSPLEYPIKFKDKLPAVRGKNYPPVLGNGMQRNLHQRPVGKR